MYIGHKRNWAARLLLAVFLPMLLLSVTHRHESSPAGNASCEDCVQHVPHAGHLMPHINHVSDCVLCQFLQIGYLIATVAFLPVIRHIVQSFYQPAVLQVSICIARLSPRAPPCIA